MAPLGQLQIAGNTSNFGPIINQIMNFPRYERLPSDIKREKRLDIIGDVEKLLIDCYFNHFNYYIPVLSRKAFMEQVCDPEQRATLGVQKLLACVLATGFAFRQELNNQYPIINQLDPGYGKDMSQRFHKDNALDVFNSSIVNCQCYLILTGYYSSVFNHDAVHNLVALAYSAAISEGLNRNKGLYYQVPNSKNHVMDPTEMGHRVFWSLMIVSSCFALGHPTPSITSHHYDILPPQRQQSDKHVDFLNNEHDDFEGIRHLAVFAPMFEIASRITDITCTATGPQPHTAVEDAREELQRWRTKTLPSELRIINPADIHAIHKLPKFAKFFHAVGYMFEISLHQNFQLHESLRERGLHIIWGRICFDAATGIKNIYSTRPITLTRMNAHIVLVLAAGAFASAVENLVGKEEIAQRYRDETRAILGDIMGLCSITEIDRHSRFIERAFKNGIKSESHMDTSESTSGTQTTDEHESPPTSEDEAGNDRASDQDDEMVQPSRVPNHIPQQRTFTPYSQDDLNRRRSQPHARVDRRHPSMHRKISSPESSRQISELTHRQHKQQQQQSMGGTHHNTPGYGNMMSGVQSASHPNTIVSPTFHPSYNGANIDEFPSASRPHVHHRVPSNPSLSAFSSSARGTTDNGFPGSHGGDDTYMAPRVHRQHQQSFGPGPSMTGGDARSHQNSVSSASTCAPGVFNNPLLQDMESGVRESSQAWQGFNEAQMMAFNSNGGYENQGQYAVHPQQSPMHPHQPSSAHNNMEISSSLSGTQLLNGTGLMMSGFGSISEDSMQDGQQRFCQPALTFSGGAGTHKPVSDPSGQSSPVTPTSSHSQHQAPMTASSQAGSNPMIGGGGGLMEHQHNSDQDPPPPSQEGDLDSRYLASQTLGMGSLTYPFPHGDSLIGSSAYDNGESPLDVNVLLGTLFNSASTHDQALFSLSSKPMQSQQQQEQPPPPPTPPQPQPLPPHQHHYYHQSQTIPYRQHLQFQRPIYHSERVSS